MLKFISLGCKVNSYESDALKELFLSNGFSDKDNIIVINTCSVTAIADQKSRQIIRREKRNNKDAVVAVMGCYSQKNADYVINECKADIVVGTSNRVKLVEYVKTFLKERKPIIDVEPKPREFKYESFGTFSLPSTTRAYVKVEDGCNNFCTYCTIPYTRGVARSRPREEIVSEIESLISHGYLEFIITGIHTAHYGLDLKNETFSSLIEELLNIDGLYRLRISSIEESEIDDKFIELLRTKDNIANHLHMPLQSGSPTVLKRMGRKYNVDDFINKVKRIREARPDIAITTDVIVGFPNETEEEFLETVNFIKKVNFAELHVFPFSAREGTPAYKMNGQVSPEVKAKRVQTLLELSEKLKENYRKKFIGKELEVIIEEKDKETGLMRGHSSNYLLLEDDVPESSIGKIVKIKVR